MTDAPETVSELGEAGVIALFTAHLPPPPVGEIWSGDDAAFVRTGARTLVTTDLLVEDVDFNMSYCNGYDVGWKAMAVNVSDIAAMGGRPTRAVGALALPTATDAAVVGDIARGLAAAARTWEVDLIGGDVSSARELSIGITLLGEPWGDAPVTREGASPGDVLCITGSVGSSWGGLVLLRGGASPDDPAARSLIERHLHPQPRVQESRRLVAAGATAMIDVSDGLAIDLLRLMEASGTGCDVDPRAVPVDPNLAVLRSVDGMENLDVEEGAILGGEDFELLVTLPPAALDAAGSDVAVIGEVTSGGCRFGGRDLKEIGRKGWDHLRGR